MAVASVRPGDNALLSPDPLPPIDHKEAIFRHVRFIMDVVPTLRAQPPPRSTSVPKTLFSVRDSVWVRDSKYDSGFPPVFAPRWKGPFIVNDRLDKNAYRLRTNPDVSGKRSTALALPINGSRLRRATAQELAAVVARLQVKAFRDGIGASVDGGAVDTAAVDVDGPPLSFVLPL